VILAARLEEADRVRGAASLPKSGAGKILKRELRKPHWAGQERQVS
jgi:acyl-coenzyme A synthetase/AMP-(fatty) acid ligase